MSESIEALRRRKHDEAEALSCGKAALWAKAEGIKGTRDLVSSLSGGAVVRCVRGMPGAEVPAGQALAVVTDPTEGGGGVVTLGEWRTRCHVPVLWWDHVVDPVQVAEARVAGADGVRITVALLDEMALDDCLTAAERAGCLAVVVVADDEEAQLAISMGADVIAARGVADRADRWRRLGATVIIDIVASGAQAATDVDAIIVGVEL